MSVYQRYWVFDGFAVEAPISVMQRIGDAGRGISSRNQSFTAPIDMVSQDAPDNEPPMEFPGERTQTSALGYDGRAARLLTWDTGVEGTHEALAPGGEVSHQDTRQQTCRLFNISPNFPTATGFTGTTQTGHDGWLLWRSDGDKGDRAGEGRDLDGMPHI